MKSMKIGIILTALCFYVGPANTSYPACSNSWVEYDGFCYKTSATATTFTDAKNACVLYGSHLVSIHSEAEDTFVKTQQVSQNGGMTLWLGMEKVSTQWTWIDGSEVDFNNFDFGNYPGSCMSKFPVWNSYRWSPSNCPSTYGSMCKKKGEYPLWTDWDSWSMCDCASPTRTRQRSCEYSGATIPSVNCAGEESETQSCVCKPDTTSSAVYVELFEGRFYPTVTTWQDEGRQVIECSRHCLSQPGCVLFQFSQTNGSCLMFDHLFDQSSALVESPHWSLWQIVYR